MNLLYGTHTHTYKHVSGFDLDKLPRANAGDSKRYLLHFRILSFCASSWFFQRNVLNFLTHETTFHCLIERPVQKKFGGKAPEMLQNQLYTANMLVAYAVGVLLTISDSRKKLTSNVLYSTQYVLQQVTRSRVFNICQFLFSSPRKVNLLVFIYPSVSKLDIPEWKQGARHFVLGLKSTNTIYCFDCYDA